MVRGRGLNSGLLQYQGSREARKARKARKVKNKKNNEWQMNKKI